MAVVLQSVHCHGRSVVLARCAGPCTDDGILKGTYMCKLARS
jgi:hypothetical protein